MNGIIGMVFLIGFFVLLFFLAKGIFNLLSLVAPVLIAGALLIHYRTVTGFLRFLWDLLRRRPLTGILAVLLTVLGFPIVSGFLFGKAILDRRIRSFQSDLNRRVEGELVDYEEIVEEEDAEILELKSLSKGKQESSSYENLFDDDNQ
jgi:hypothetical protein